MIDYQFNSTIVLRTPVYSYTLYSDGNLANILKQSFFQKAIYFASESFYNELKKIDFDFGRLDKKGIETVKKYFNRMCYRPTPFGIYAAIGSLSWSNKDTFIRFLVENLHPHLQLSYAKSIQYSEALLHVHQLDDTYKLTPAIYKSGNEYRFLRSTQGGSPQIDFVIDSIKNNRFFNNLTEYINKPQTIKEISAFIVNQTSCTDDDALNYIDWLIEHQVITHLLSANITGEDYIKRLLKVGHLNQYTTYPLIKNINKLFSEINNVSDLDVIPTAINEIANEVKSADLYVNLQINLPGANLNDKYQKDILNGLHCLNRLTPIQQASGLKDFVKNFNQKFENQVIPLLTALDPEIGVGYGDLAVEDDNIDIVKDIQGGSIAIQHTSITWGKVHALFFNKWKTGVNQHIVITDDDLYNIGDDNDTSAPGISVMFRIVDDKVLIESAGEATATLLIGRFTPFDTDIKVLAQNVALQEAEYNPGVVFAEIAHVCHNHTANIDRREHIYQYEIPIMVQSIASEENQILLSDLWVSVMNGEIILQSRRMGKRVIPRLSSAFNYTRNDLAVFRFLCDLQYAGIKSNLNFNLNRLFPNLRFYPRVVYKNTILQLAYWVLKNDAFTKAMNATGDQQYLIFGEIKQDIGLPNHVGLTQHDNQLVFDLNNRDDVSFFLDVIKNQTQFTLKEYLLPGENAVVSSEHNQPHINQFITSLYAKAQIYQPIIANIKINKVERRKITPGEDWLYFKLYCHSIRSNELLRDSIFKLLKRLMSAKLIDQYFFIRYLDPGYHIRLRLKVQPQMHQQVINEMYLTVGKYVEQGIISNYTIAIYERELERYHTAFMEYFEYSFYASSKFVLSFLNQTTVPLTAASVLGFAITSVSDMLEALDMQGEPLIAFLENVFASFAHEFSGITDLKYQLDIAYRKQKIDIESAMKNQLKYYQELKLIKQQVIFKTALSELKNIAAEKKVAWQQKWIADLIHMHLNRLFTNDSRKQEMAVYYFLSKYHRSVQARLKKG